MDDLDRLFQRLVHNIRNGHAEYLSVPFTVQELYDTLVPYRHYRRDLGIETNQDYEAAVSRLLSGEKGYVRADKAMQDRLKKELESPHADVGAFRDYAESRISLAPDALQQLGVAVPAQNAGGYAPPTATAARQARAAPRFPCRARWKWPKAANSAAALCPKDARSLTARTAARIFPPSTARAAARSWTRFGNSALTAGRRLDCGLRAGWWLTAAC
jgi:hypothetical protein